MGPYYIAMAVASLVESINASCNRYPREFIKEAQRIKELAHQRENTFMQTVYIQRPAGTWESLSCDELSQIRLCQSFDPFMKTADCKRADAFKVKAEETFFQSYFSKPGRESNPGQFELVLKPQSYSSGIIKARLKQCSDFRRGQNDWIKMEKSYLGDLKDLMGKGPSCGEVFDSIVATLPDVGKSEKQTPSPRGCFSDNYLSESDCKIAANLAQLMTPTSVGIGFKGAKNLAKLVATQSLKTAGPEAVGAEIEAYTAGKKLITPNPPSTTPPGGVQSTGMRFNAVHNDDFTEELKKFRGGKNEWIATQKMSGTEGRVFPSDLHPDRALKRYFHTDKIDPGLGIGLLKQARRAYEASPELAKYLRVAKIYSERTYPIKVNGHTVQRIEWIERDFVKNSIPLATALRSSNPAEVEAIQRAIRGTLEALGKSDERWKRNIIKMLTRNPLSPNVHWSPTEQRLFIFDMTQYTSPIDNIGKAAKLARWRTPKHKKLCRYIASLAFVSVGHHFRQHAGYMAFEYLRLRL